MNSFTLDMAWWISAVEIPIVAGFLWLIRSNRRDLEKTLNEQRKEIETRLDRLQRGFSRHKEDVVKRYVPFEYIKEMEGRLTNLLVHINEKLDS